MPYRYSPYIQDYDVACLMRENLEECGDAGITQGQLIRRFRQRADPDDEYPNLITLNHWGNLMISSGAVRIGFRYFINSSRTARKIKTIRKEKKEHRFGFRRRRGEEID